MTKPRKGDKLRRPNPEAKRLADARFRQRIVADKRRKADTQHLETEMRDAEADEGPSCEGTRLRPAQPANAR